MREPRGERHHAVELIAMDDEEPPAIRRLVDGLGTQLDARERQAAIFAEGLVVIAGDEDDAGSLFDLAQDGVDDAGLRVAPVPGPLQTPAIDNVADQIER